MSLEQLKFQIRKKNCEIFFNNKFKTYTFTLFYTVELIMNYSAARYSFAISIHYKHESYKL